MLFYKKIVIRLTCSNIIVTMKLRRDQREVSKIVKKKWRLRRIVTIGYKQTNNKRIDKLSSDCVNASSLNMFKNKTDMC